MPLRSRSLPQPGRRERAAVAESALVVGLAAMLLVLGALLGLVKTKNLLAALGLIAAIATAVAIVSAIALRYALRRSSDSAELAVERLEARAFAVLAVSARAALGISDETTTFRLIAPSDVAALERHASEVWTYAYDLKWDAETDGFEDVVRLNLEDGKRYLYLVPPDKTILSTAEDLICRYREVPNLKDLFQFRVRTAEVGFAPFGLSIYNPARLRETTVSDEDGGVVLFPHFEHSRGANDDPFLGATDSSVGGVNAVAG